MQFKPVMQKLMKTSLIIGFKSLAAIFTVLGLASTQAQQDNWIGPASGGEWNTAANWNLGGPPGVATNGFIGISTNVSYTFPMLATGFGTLTNDGVLTVNTTGFNPSGIYELSPNGTGKLFVNPGGVVTVTGNVGLCSNSVASMTAGTTVSISGTLIIGSDTAGGTGGAATVLGDGSFTNWGGSLTAAGVSLNPKNASLGTGANCRLVIAGGTNNLGAYAAQRSPGGNSAPSALGTDGLIVSNGFVNLTSISIGNNAHGVMYLVGGVVTNTGTFTLKNSTLTRPARFIQAGGLFVDPDPNVVSMNPSGTADTAYSVLGGTNIIGGMLFNGTNYFTNAATMYVGSQGISESTSLLSVNQLLGGGLLGATAPWTCSAPLTLNTGGGTFTFQTADQSGNPNNITLNNPLNGSGSLTVAGTGVLALNAANTYQGNTYVNQGTLSLGSSATVITPKLFVSSGTTYDVSQVSGYTLNANQQLSGSGTVNGTVTAAATAVVFPGSNSLTGTLTFNSGLTENGNVINEFNLVSSPNGPGNDFMNVSGGLNLSGINTVAISGTLQNGGVYPLIGYNGNLTGGIANLTVSGATGIFSNSTSSSIIYFIPQTSVRGPTNITWIGNALNNVWDVENTTNWLNAGTAALDFFVPNDTTVFSNLGASNSQVNISSTVTPTLVIVNTTSNYTFLGNGAIGGTAGITVNNGTVNILTTNNYSGVTTFDGGVLVTPLIANSGSPSGIGAASSFAGNVIFNGGTLAYDGPSVGTDHGITLTNNGGTIDVTNGTTLTLNGPLFGNGNLTLVDSGTLTLTAANSYSGNAIIDSGTLNLDNVNGAGTGTIILSGGTLGMVLGSQQIYPNNVTVVSNSTINSAGGNNNEIGGVWTVGTNVTASFVIASNGTFTVNGSMTNYSGTVELGNSAGIFRFNGGGGNTQFGGPNATFDLGTNFGLLEARNPGTMAVGALDGGPNTVVKGPGSTAGILVWQFGGNTNVPNATYYGRIQDNAGNENSGIDKIGIGTTSLAGQSTYTGNTTIDSGVLALTNNPFTSTDGSIGNSSNIIINAGGMLDVTGRSDGTMTLNTSQVLGGVGTLHGTLNTGNGIVSPGGGLRGALGTLNVNGTVNLNGIAWMKVIPGGSPNSDRLVATGGNAINYGGTLVLTNVGGAYHVGETFTLFTGSALNGSFNLALPLYYSWDTSQLNVNGSIKLLAILPPPSFNGIDVSQLSNGVMYFTLTNGAPNSMVNLLTTTNIATPLKNWTVLAQMQFDGNGNITEQPIGVDPTLPQSFYAIQSPQQ